MTDPKPPTRAPLSRPRILKAALRLIDERGLDALSMRSLGAELGVEAMSLYRHVPSKAALLDGVVELMLAEVATDPLPAGLPWRGLLADVARRYRSLARRHPGAFVLLVEHPERGYVAGRDATVGVLTALEAAGLRVVRPPEGWLLKAWDGDVLVDLITEPVGLDAAQAIGRAEEVRVLGLHVLALRPEDVLTSMLLARTDLWLDFEGLLRAVRMVRERVDWDEVRERTRESPYAVGFMAMTEALGLVDGAPGRPAPGGG